MAKGSFRFCTFFSEQSLIFHTLCIPIVWGFLFCSWSRFLILKHNRHTIHKIAVISIKTINNIGTQSTLADKVESLDEAPLFINSDIDKFAEAELKSQLQPSLPQQITSLDLAGLFWLICTRIVFCNAKLLHCLDVKPPWKEI